jgi:asparagine synthase (glutamine-hydrolysing)
MCGIAGIYNSDRNRFVEESVITSMANEMAHRGPDALSCHVEGNIGFGFRRLSIIDLLHGNQPFFSDNKEVMLICNGEIFNYRELRVELESRGHRFKTNCDVEVIIYLYLEHGRAFLNLLNGQFAFAIFDKSDNSLFLARDQFGICPLYYSVFDGMFVFASEIKAILKVPGVKKEVDPECLDQVFTFPGPVSPVTMFKGIRSLAAGNYMVVGPGKIETVQYWDLIYPEISECAGKPEEFYLETLEELLLKSVKYRINADVPIGFYLSGGLDSSLVGALMKTVAPENDYPCFSICFPSDNEMNERHYQQEMVRHLNATSREMLFDRTEVEKKLTQAVRTSECALKESYNTCSLALSEMVSHHGIKVVLSGEGADELFGGYVGYRFDKQRRPNAEIKDMEERMEDDYRTRLWGDPDFFYEKNYFDFNNIKKSLYSKGMNDRFGTFDSTVNLVFDKGRIRNRDILHKRSYIDLKLRLSDHLIADHCDRTTYANSVEGRFPFLDIALVEFVKTIPPDIKLKGLNEKYILKKLAAKYLPDSIINRQKFGFIAPGSPWLLQANSEWINDLMSYDRIKRQGYFNPDAIESLKKKYAAPGYTLNLPFESDLLIVVMTFNIFIELFKMPDFS